MEEEEWSQLFSGSWNMPFSLGQASNPHSVADCGYGYGTQPVVDHVCPCRSRARMPEKAQSRLDGEGLLIQIFFPFQGWRRGGWALGMVLGKVQWVLEALLAGAWDVRIAAK